MCSATLVLCAVVLPRMSKGWGSGIKSWAYEWRQSSIALICLVALPALLFWAAPGTIIHYLYGAQFLRAAASLEVLGPATAILCFGYSTGQRFNQHWLGTATVGHYSGRSVGERRAESLAHTVAWRSRRSLGDTRLRRPLRYARSMESNSRPQDCG